MAKGSKSKSDSVSPKQNAKLADIFTAAKSTMEPKDYSAGYPMNQGANFSGKDRTGGKK